MESAAAAGTRSGVAFCMAMACATAFLIIPAAFPHPRYSNIIALDKISEVGLAQFFPASCGAVPCVASKIAAPVWKLILLPGAIPKPPTCAANAKESPDYQEHLQLSFFHFNQFTQNNHSFLLISYFVRTGR